MILYYAYHDGPWRLYLNRVGLEQNVVSVPVPASWQTNANNMRVTTEMHIRAKMGNQGQSISNTISQVTFLGDDAIMLFLGLLDPSVNGGSVATQTAELAQLSNNCFTNPITLNMLPENQSFTQARVGRIWLNFVLLAWRQVTNQTFHVRPTRPAIAQSSTGSRSRPVRAQSSAGSRSR